MGVIFLACILIAFSLVMYLVIKILSGDESYNKGYFHPSHTTFIDRIKIKFKLKKSYEELTND